MINLTEAIKIAETERNKFEYGSKVDSAIDCGDRWAFDFSADKGLIGSAPVFVFKENGKCEFFFMTEENTEILQRGKRVNLPED